jgi:UDP-GlcNAc:undecaprenyl-phosphate GlcNAc-1-phosphate transferase
MDELDALWAFLVAAALAFGATPPVAALARRVGVLHQPRERDLHDKPVPRLGGLAILVAVVVAGVLFLPDERSTRGILIGAVAIALVGAWDDYLPGGLPPVVKLAGQLGAAAIPVFAGDVRVERVTLPFIDPFQLGDWSYLLSLLGIVAVMNVVNFTDGADGLAAGVCTIAAGTFAVVALFFPLVILAVPAADATYVVAKRIKYRRPVYRADASHFHHRLARIGFSQRRTVLYMYGWTLSLAALALAMRFVPYSDDDGTLNPGWTVVIVAFGVMALAASVYLVLVLEILKFKRFREREYKRRVETGEIAAISRNEMDREIEREVETGEFQAVPRE